MRIFTQFRSTRGSIIGVPALSLLAFLSGCASGSSEGPSHDAEASSPGQLIAAGAQVYGNNCARCHNARAAAEKTDIQWDIVVAHMRARANLTGGQARAVQAFLSAVNAPPSGGDEEVPQTSQEEEASPQEQPTSAADLPLLRLRESSSPRRSGPFASEVELSGFSGQGGSRPLEVPDTLVEKGRSLSGAKGCIGCHVLEKKGGSIGPSLDDLFERRDEGFIRDKLKDPRSDNPNSVMPNYAMTDEDIDAIVAYLGSLSGKVVPTGGS